MRDRLLVFTAVSTASSTFELYFIQLPQGCGGSQWLIEWRRRSDLRENMSRRSYDRA